MKKRDIRVAINSLYESIPTNISYKESINRLLEKRAELSDIVFDMNTILCSYYKRILNAVNVANECRENIYALIKNRDCLSKRVKFYINDKFEERFYANDDRFVRLREGVKSTLEELENGGHYTFFSGIPALLEEDLDIILEEMLFHLELKTIANNEESLTESLREESKKLLYDNFFSSFEMK